MAILNYTTEVPAPKSVSLITEMLAQHGATAILTELENKKVTAISFKVVTAFGLLSFRLPSDTERVFQVIYQDRKIPPRFKSREQAERVAWRIQKDWLEAQLALIQIGLATLVQVFLPYAQNPTTGQTVYEVFAERRFKELTAPPEKT